ncbi:MAG: hypothetical protein ACE5D7_04100 [Fidelibacterota bacterium]
MQQIGFVLLVIGIIMMLMNYLSGGFLVLGGIILMVIGKRQTDRGHR